MILRLRETRFEPITYFCLSKAFLAFLHTWLVFVPYKSYYNSLVAFKIGAAVVLAGWKQTDAGGNCTSEESDSKACSISGELLHSDFYSERKIQT